VAARIHLAKAARGFAHSHLNSGVVYKELIDFLDEQK
jgi:hypothetical protein